MKGRDTTGTSGKGRREDEEALLSANEKVYNFSRTREEGERDS